MLVAGGVLLVAGAGLLGLLMMVGPPSGGWDPTFLLLVADIGAIGVVALANGVYTRAHGVQNNLLRGASFVLAAGFVGLCFASMR